MGQERKLLERFSRPQDSEGREGWLEWRAPSTLFPRYVCKMGGCAGSTYTLHAISSLDYANSWRGVRKYLLYCIRSGTKGAEGVVVA